MGLLAPGQLVAVMEEYARAGSYWDRSLLHAATADIARRPAAFEVGMNWS